MISLYYKFKIIFSVYTNKKIMKKCFLKKHFQ